MSEQKVKVVCRKGLTEIFETPLAPEGLSFELKIFDFDEYFDFADVLSRRKELGPQGYCENLLALGLVAINGRDDDAEEMELAPALFMELANRVRDINTVTQVKK